MTAIETETSLRPAGHHRGARPDAGLPRSRPGIVHAVSGFLLEHGCDIIDNQQFGERSEGHFFMRVHFASDGDASTADTLRAAFAPVAERFGMSWRLEPHGSKRRVLIMVSKFGHCLNDLLFRARIGELPVDVVAVVSNHTDHQALVEWHGIPFFHVPVTAATKPEAEARLLELVDEFDVELVVLARYMQVLSDDLTRQAGRPGHQHPPLVPAQLQGRQAVPPGLRPRREDRGRHRALRQRASWTRGRSSPSRWWRWTTPTARRTWWPPAATPSARRSVNAVRWHCEGRVILQGNRTVVLR